MRNEDKIDDDGGRNYEHGCSQVFFRNLAGFCTDSNFPQNPEMQWRLTALGRPLTFDLPRTFRFPYVLGFTVMIPHNGKSIYIDCGCEQASHNEVD